MSNKNSQSGFTLIELLIVVLIIGILASIAIPVFNGQRTKAKNSVAQSTVRNAMTAASSAFVGNNDSYDGVTIMGASKSLQAEESTIKEETDGTKKPGSTADDKAIFGSTSGTGGSTSLVICTASKGDTTYCAKQDVTNGTPSAWKYGKFTNTTLTAAASGTITANNWN